MFKIFSKKKVEKIKYLIDGNSEDREIAKELLLKTNQSRNRSKYRILIKEDRSIAQVRKFPFVWKDICIYAVNNKNPDSRNEYIKFLKDAIKTHENKPKFKKYTIKL